MMLRLATLKIHLPNAATTTKHTQSVREKKNETRGYSSLHVGRCCSSAVYSMRCFSSSGSCYRAVFSRCPFQLCFGQLCVLVALCLCALVGIQGMEQFFIQINGARKPKESRPGEKKLKRIANEWTETNGDEMNGMIACLYLLKRWNYAVTSHVVEAPATGLDRSDLWWQRIKYNNQTNRWWFLIAADSLSFALRFERFYVHFRFDFYANVIDHPLAEYSHCEFLVFRWGRWETFARRTNKKKQ